MGRLQTQPARCTGPFSLTTATECLNPAASSSHSPNFSSEASGPSSSPGERPTAQHQQVSPETARTSSRKGAWLLVGELPVHSVKVLGVDEIAQRQRERGVSKPGPGSPGLECSGDEEEVAKEAGEMGDAGRGGPEA